MQIDSNNSIDIIEHTPQPLPPIIRATEQAIGLFYGGFMFLGIAVGGLIGFLVSGGSAEFLRGGWIDVTIGAVLGAMFGLGCGEITNAVLIMRNNKDNKQQ